VIGAIPENLVLGHSQDYADWLAHRASQDRSIELTAPYSNGRF
jgi:hypothetical protein